MIKKLATEKHVPNLLHGIQNEEENKQKRKEVLTIAELETCRILNFLGFPLSLKAIILEKFKELRAALRPGTKYRIPEKLAPITMYFVLKLQKFPFKEKELLEVSHISKKEFAAFKLQIMTFLSAYA